MVVEALGYIIHNRISQRLVKAKPLYGPNVGQLMNGPFMDDSLLTFIEGKQSFDNIVDYMQILCEAFKSNLQMAKR
jgi:hypothetical protein